MKQFTYTITDPLGIHGRPAGDLVKLAKSFAGTKITISKDGKSTDLTRLIMLMGLGVKGGDTVTITAQGNDEQAAVEKIESFLKENM